MRLLIFLLLIPVLAFTQNYEEYTADDLFSRGDASLTVRSDSVYDTGASYYSVWTGASAADTLISTGMPNAGGGNDITVHCGVDSISGTTDVEAFFGIYRGVEAGWLWYSMGTLSSDGGSITWHVGNQSWAVYYVISGWGIKFEETGNQRNGLWARAVKFNWR